MALSHQQAHSRNVLATLFWPDEAEKAAMQNLRLSLYRLRQLLGDTHKEASAQEPIEPYLLVTRSTVQFNPASHFSLDVVNFLEAVAEGALETAVALYQGDLLPGFNCDSLPVEAWLRTERERYHRLALEAMYKLAAHSLAQADYQKAQAYAQQQLDLEPWREEAHRQLMQALALRGEQSAAVAQYEICRALLAKELGIPPTLETKNLLVRIQSQRAVQTVSLKSNRPSEQLTIPFVGRHAEYNTLVDTFQQTASHGLQVVTLSGKAGIGKTRLTEQFLAWAAMQGADTLRSRALETSSSLSYQPLTQLIRQRLEQENAPEDLLSDFWLSQLTRLLPELRDRYPDLPEPTQDANVGREHLFEAMTRLLLALATQKPLLISIDDWHWADSASRDALHYALLRWTREGLPIMLLLGLRQEAVADSANVQQWLTQLNHSVAVTALRLEPLTNEETTQLIQLLFDPEKEEDKQLSRFSAWLFAESKGQPLFLTETLKALAAQELVRPSEETAHWRLDNSKFEQKMAEKNGRVIPSIQQIIKGWLVRISHSANKLLTAAAILVQTGSFDLLRYTANLEEGEAQTALDELLNKQLLLETHADSFLRGHEPVYTFSHQKVSEVVYLEAGAARRRVFHRRAFEALQEKEVPAADLVHHAIHAGLLTKTIRYSLIAGNEALDMLSAQIAIDHFKTAFQSAQERGWPKEISGADRQALYIGLGSAYQLCEQAEQAQDVYEQMVAYAREIGATSMECQGLNRLAELYNMALLDTEKAFAVLEQAWAVAERTGDRRGMAETAQNLSSAAGNTHDIENGLKYAHQAFELARELDHPHLLANCLRCLAYVYPDLREWALVEQYATEAQQRFEALGNLMLANDIQRLVGASQMQNGRAQEGLETIKKAYAFIQQVENEWEQSDVARFLALIHAELGQYGQAIQLVDEAMDKVRKVNHPMITITLANYGTVYRSVLALDEAQEAWLTLLEAVENGAFYPFPDEGYAELCAIYALKGEWDKAYGCAQRVLAFHEGKDLPPMGKTGWFETEALLRGGDEHLARAEVARTAEAIGSNRRYQLPLRRSQAVLARWDGDAVQAIEHLEEALALAQEMELLGEVWPILGELGKLYGELGKEDEARAAYGEAAVIIHHLAETIDDEELRKGFLSAASI
ncbi:MAG: AAA family ATPase [Anaerolineales bacterium]|nr:AAA family ATPase [Anaerolineales bacterium]